MPLPGAGRFDPSSPPGLWLDRRVKPLLQPGGNALAVLVRTIGAGASGFGGKSPRTVAKITSRRTG